jgi:hypothetical protein
MALRIYAIACAALALFPASPPCAATPSSSHEKTVWNYDGGVFISTEGAIPSGPCFKISVRLTAEDFFDNLKRVDVDGGTIFRRGSEILTQFPDKLALSFSIRDLPCTLQQQVESQNYLTQTVLKSLRLSFFWKRGTELRPAQYISRTSSKVERILPYATELAETLPERFEWFSQFDVPSAGVPLTDSLVLIFRTADGKIAARVAARL